MSADQRVDRAPRPEDDVERMAVIDMGSNSFRLVVFEFDEDRSWRHADEIREGVRVGQGMDGDGRLQPKPFKRALRTAASFADYLREHGIGRVITVATSAIRDAANGDELVEEVRTRTGLEVRVLSGEEEARYAYLAIANTTAVSNGFGLELGGGSLQLMRLLDGHLGATASLPLGAVRVSEQFLADSKPSGKAIRKLRSHVEEGLERVSWWQAGEGRGVGLAGVGGTVRNLASAAGRRSGELTNGVQGYVLSRDALDELIDELASMPADARGDVPGIKSDRGDVILGGALVLAGAMEHGGFEAIEVTQSGLREALLLEWLEEEHRPPASFRAVA